MTYLTHGNYKGTRWFPRCCCQPCEIIRDRFTRYAPIDASRWEVIRGNWGTHSDARATADGRRPLQETGGSLPALVVGVQELPDADPDFYTVTDVTIKTSAQPFFVVDFTDAATDTYHAVRVTYEYASEDKLTVDFLSYNGTTATQLGDTHVIDWDPDDPGEFLRATFTVCLNGDNLSIQMSSGTTGTTNDATGKDSPPDFFVAEDITAKHGGKRAGLGFSGGLSAQRQGTRWNSFELHIHENQKDGCPSCLACVCQGPPADEYDVTIEGFNDSTDSCCDNCADLDGEFTLRYRPDLSTAGVCVWQYEGAYAPMWTCGFPGGSPCVALDGLDISFLRLTVKADTDAEDNEICRWKFTAGNPNAGNYFGATWGRLLNAASCDCDLSSADFEFGGTESGTAGETHSTAETVLDPDGNPSSRNGIGQRWFSEVCDVTSVTITVSAA